MQAIVEAELGQIGTLGASEGPGAAPQTKSLYPRIPLGLDAMRHAAQAPDRCSVSGCKSEAEHSLPAEKVRGALGDLRFEGEGKHLALCREHYKQFKKATKDERKIEQAYW